MKPILLIAAMPTPNGRLHLGHIGGQFLKLDILKRYLKRSGIKVLLMCGLDIYDNAISYSAYRDNTTEREVCTKYYKCIKDDLNIMDISYDYFINWLDLEWESKFKDTLKSIDERLSSHKVNISENIPFELNTKTPVVGRWLKGSCPQCNREMLGYSCDPCSIYFSPEKIMNPTPIKGGEIQWRNVNNQFINLHGEKLINYIRKLNINEEYKSIAYHFIKASKAQSRWTACDSWGVSTESDGHIFYNANFSLIEQIIFGEIAKNEFNLSKNAFDDDNADVIKVIAYGRDCIPVLLVNIPGLAFTEGSYSNFEVHLISEFYMLDGKKMSTNKQYGVWVKDIDDSDAVRHYLCSISNSENNLNINSENMLSYIMKYSTDVKIKVLLLIDELISQKNFTICYALLEDLKKIILIQASYLNLISLNLSKAVRCIDEWMENYYTNKPNSTFTWLIGFAYLSWPFTPKIVNTIEQRLKINLLNKFAELGLLKIDEEESIL